MADKDNPLLNPGGSKPAPSVEIPDLQKKEEEKKKAGAAGSWGNAKEAFSGARGGSGLASQGAAARSAASAARAVMAGGGQPQWLTALARLLGVNSRLLSLALGRGLMAAALVGAVAAGGVMAGRSPQAKVASIAMGELRTAIKTQVSNSVGSSLPRSLGSYRDFFGGGKPAAPSGGLTAPAQTAAPESPLPVADSLMAPQDAGAPADASAGPERRANLLNKSGLSGTGGQLARSGAMAIGQSKVYDRSRLLDFSKGDVAQGKFQGYYSPQAKSGKAMKMKEGKYASGKGGGRSHIKAFNSRALGQLRTMGTRTGTITAAGTNLEEASAVAQQQFENSGEGGKAPEGAPEAPEATPTTGGNTSGNSGGAIPGGGGGFDCSQIGTGLVDDGKGGCTPGHTEVTPWAKELEAANALILTASIIMIAAGIASQIKPYGYIVSVILGAIAIALCVAAIVLGAIIIDKGGDLQGGLTIGIAGFCILEAALAMAGKLSLGLMIILPLAVLLYAIINMTVGSSSGAYTPEGEDPAAEGSQTPGPDGETPPADTGGEGRGGKPKPPGKGPLPKRETE